MGVASILAGFTNPWISHKFGRANAGWIGLYIFLVGLIAISFLQPVALTILGLLLMMSVGTWFYIVSKGWRYQQASAKTREFLKQFWAAPDLEAVARQLRASGINDPFSHLVHHGFTAVEQHHSRQRNTLIDAGTAEEFLTRSLKRAIDQDKARLEGGLTFLATVASSAPFVGLFGTVWGIYHALTAIGISGQASIDKVAGPVGEALIMTAIGLAVAVPAVLAYNWLVRRNKAVMDEVRAFGSDLHAVVLGTIKA